MDPASEYPTCYQLRQYGASGPDPIRRTVSQCCLSRSSFEPRRANLCERGVSTTLLTEHLDVIDIRSSRKRPNVDVPIECACSLAAVAFEQFAHGIVDAGFTPSW